MVNNRNRSRASAAETTLAANMTYKMKHRWSQILAVMATMTKRVPPTPPWQENDCVFMFLVGLNKYLNEVRGKVLGKISLSTLRETFVEIRREEAQQGIMMGKTPRSSESEGSTLATRNLDEEKRSDTVPLCDHCKHEWHTRETCWKLKGKHPNWKKKCGHAFQASNSDKGHQSPSNQLALTTEHLDKPYKLLESPTHSCSIATKGNQKIKIADGSFSAIAGFELRKMIRSAKENGGLYYLDIGYASQLP
ncbi:hypothetical protein KIW84_014709 [Lathyrus oleraceus]|uniref:Uncharacterized protein n=1 Tax=Pisum sativum TaxID=3888 RepID=A0A9D5BNZ2_PEA|nr:hypothetical protein KIW84_014709 [Pisum sativum]